MGCLYRSPALKAQGIYLCERGSGKIVNVRGGRGGPQGKSIFQHSKTDRCTETVIAMDLPNLKPEWDTSGHRVPSLVKELLALDCCSEQKGLFSSVKLPLVDPPHSRAGSMKKLNCIFLSCFVFVFVHVNTYFVLQTPGCLWWLLAETPSGGDMVPE